MKIDELKVFQGFIFENDIENVKNLTIDEARIYVKSNGVKFSEINGGPVFVIKEYSNLEVIPVKY